MTIISLIYFWGEDRRKCAFNYVVRYSNIAFHPNTKVHIYFFIFFIFFLKLIDLLESLQSINFNCEFVECGSLYLHSIYGYATVVSIRLFNMDFLIHFVKFKFGFTIMLLYIYKLHNTNFNRKYNCLQCVVVGELGK